MNNKEKIKKFLKKYKPVFWCMLSNYYDFTQDQYEKFSDNLYWNNISQKINKNNFNLVIKNKEKVNFNYLLENSNFELDEDLISEYKNHLNWEHLSKNKNIIWTEDLIDKYSNLLHWGLLSRNPKIKWTKNLLEKYKNEIVWYYMVATNEAIEWSEDLIIFIENLNIYDFSCWYSICTNKSFPWTIDFIERNINKIDWVSISANSSIPLTEEFIEKYKEKINWNGLSSNTGLEFTPTLIEKYLKRWNWSNLSLNTSIKWNKNFIQRYIYYIDWNNLSSNKSLVLNEELLINYSDKWNYKLLLERNDFEWSEDFIEKYKDILDWEFISRLKKFNFSEEFIERNKDRLNWDTLGSNESAPWSIDFILKYEKIWDWFYIANYRFIWDKVFKESINDELIEEVYKDKSQEVEIKSPEFPQLFERLFEPKFLRKPKWFPKILNKPYYVEEKINPLSNIIGNLYSINLKKPISNKDYNNIKDERMFINNENFFSIYLEENKLFISSGKIGTLGQQNIINYNSLNESFSEYEKLILLKISEGFKEKEYDVNPIIHSVMKKLDIVGKKHSWKPITEDNDGSVYDSKFCGTPFLFENEEWPTCYDCDDNKPLLHFLQIDIQKLPSEFWSSLGFGLFQFFKCPEFCDGKLIRVINIDDKRPQNIKLPEEFTEAYIPKLITGWIKLKSELPEGYILGEISEKIGISFSDEEENFMYENESSLGIERAEGDKLGGYPSYTQVFEECKICNKSMNLIFEFKGEDNIPFKFGYIDKGFIYQCPDHKDFFSYVEGY